MVLVQASRINLPTPPSKTPASLLFEPHSFSLALLHSDSSLSLFPSISFPVPSHKKSLTIPSPSSSSIFLLQKTQLNPNPRVLFIVGGPYKGGSKVLLRFFLFRNDDSKVFEKAKVVVSNQKGIEFDDKVGVLIDVSHGLKVMIAGSVNFFAFYSASSSKVWIFGVKLVGNDEGDDGVVFKLMKCAVIDCTKPVFSMSVSSECLVLGEENGVRVWNLRELVKGKKIRRVKYSGLSNGVIGDSDGFGGGGSSSSGIVCNGYLNEKIEKHCVSVKQRSGKYRQESAEEGACFVAFEQKEVKGLKSTKVPFMSMKAISIQPLSPKKFLILNSIGDLSVLHVLNTAVGSNITCHMRQLPHVLKVQKLAVLPDISSRRQTVWISDGNHSVHMMDITSAVNENDERESDEKLLRISGFVNRHISPVENYELCHIYTLTFIKLWKCWYMPGIVLIYFEVGSFCILCELSESSMIWRT
ncbi:PREDICTED: uncharacterized protein LOC18602088 isoform X1 [Theobroma cacao]|uniref:Uncharacterized protein LOC18602088 isoform X1 n=1 Tax=Theobroma cacao TaxID=3641 RepID=A0AB32W9R1_THECC|nr:PREDICTED: uncharacterized protein LOC18602088 isoform X1 [Theobroma cacao]XP_017974807.1 PREDICTED: uncharacterized protein LOC18602088 isoform X1 [Theobroma cacao]